jgi:hypothetical protein
VVFVKRERSGAVEKDLVAGEVRGLVKARRPMERRSGATSIVAVFADTVVRVTMVR